MKYELIKKLKDAGLGDGSFGFIDGTKVPILSGLSLSELIEACGDSFEGLTMEHSHTGNEWNALAFHLGQHGHGKTPEEAVANLWLELNKK